MNNKLNRNIKLDYIYCFTRNFDLSSAIWVLYLVYRGLPLWQIGVLEGIFHCTSLFTEVPTGAIADLIGRKKIIIIGRLCSAFSSMLMLFSNSFLGFSFAFIFSAWGYNFNSGSEEALVYDSLKLLGKEIEYIKINAKLNVIVEVSQSISVFLGGILSEYSFTYCYLAAIIISIVSYVFALYFIEPKINSNGSNNKYISFKKHFSMCKKTLKENKKIRKILLYYPVVFSFYTVLFFYGQQYFSDLGLNIFQISIIMLISGFISCIGALSCKKILKIFKKRTVYIVSLLLSVGIIGMFLNNLILSIVCFMMSSYANALLYPIHSSSLNKFIPSEQRATIISVDSMLFSITMIIIFPITGIFAEIIGLNNMFFLLGITLLFMIRNFTIDTSYI